jgi:hypothetical protein
MLLLVDVAVLYFLGLKAMLCPLFLFEKSLIRSIFKWFEWFRLISFSAVAKLKTFLW